MDRNTAVTTWRDVCGSDTVMASGIVTGRMLEEFARRIEAAEREKLADDTADALRFRWLCEHPDWHFIERLCREFVADSNMEFLAGLRRVIDARRSVELGPFEEHLPPGPNVRAKLPAEAALPCGAKEN